MKLSSVTVQFTVTLHDVEVDKESGLTGVRRDLYYKAFNEIDQLPLAQIQTAITDCPDYPALVTEGGGM